MAFLAHIVRWHLRETPTHCTPSLPRALQETQGGIGFAQPGAANGITVSTLVKAPTASALHVLHGFLHSTAPPGPAHTAHSSEPQDRSQAAPTTPLVELHNHTVWCGGGWDVAVAAAAAAAHVAHACGAAPPAPAMVHSAAAACAAADVCMRAPSIRAAGALHAWAVTVISCAACAAPAP